MTGVMEHPGTRPNSECRARIDRDAPPGEHENLLAVLQVLAGLRYNEPAGRRAPRLSEFRGSCVTNRRCRRRRAIRSPLRTKHPARQNSGNGSGLFFQELSADEPKKSR